MSKRMSQMACRIVAARCVDILSNRTSLTAILRSRESPGAIEIQTGCSSSEVADRVERQHAVDGALASRRELVTVPASRQSVFGALKRAPFICASAFLQGLRQS
jgi:hypothetical protein